MKTKLKFEDYKNFLEASQIGNEINRLEKSDIDVGSPEELIKNNKLILKAQQKFKSERVNVFFEEINNIALSSIYTQNNATN